MPAAGKAAGPVVAVDLDEQCPAGHARGDAISPGGTCSTRAPSSVAGSQNPTVAA